VAQSPATIDAVLGRLKTNLALLVQSSAVEERALWSPRADYLACRLAGQWLKIPLTDLQLTKGLWHGQRAGMLSMSTSFHELSPSELEQCRAASDVQPILIRDQASTLYALKPNGTGTALVAMAVNGSSRQLWSSRDETCYSLSLSPDEKYLTCLCERSGLLLTKVK